MEHVWKKHHVANKVATGLSVVRRREGGERKKEVVGKPRVWEGRDTSA